MIRKPGIHFIGRARLRRGAPVDFQAAKDVHHALAAALAPLQRRLRG